MILVRIVSNLLRMAISLALFPVFFLMRNLFGMILLVGIGYVLFSSYQADRESATGALSPEPNAQLTTMRHQTPSGELDAKGAPIMIDRVTLYEDGNSAFSSDLLAKMSRAELEHYSHVFFWVMSNLPDGQHHQWNQHNIAGTLNPTKTFRNKRGHACRYFNESLKVHEVHQTLNGMACQRNGGGWCKLRTESTPGCNLGRPAPGMLEEIGNAINNLF